MSSILLQSLKFSGIAILSLLFLGCNRAPDACIETSAVSVLVGSPLTIKDCSEWGFDNVINLGNGAKFNNKKSLVYSYYQSGSYRIELTAFSKNGDKKETAATGISVTYPKASSILGNWTLTKVEKREQLTVDLTKSIFELPIDSVVAFNEVYTITDDSIFVQHHDDRFYLFQFENSYSYENGAIKLNDESFLIVKITTDDMVLKGPYFKGMALLHLKR